MTTENWTKSEPRLILERACPCALDWCPGEIRTILDPDMLVKLGDLSELGESGFVSVGRFLDGLSEKVGGITEWYCTTHEMGGSACGSETCSVGREHHDSINCSPVRR